MTLQKDSHREKETSYQLRALSALVVCEETETFVAVTFQEDHTSRWASVPVQTEIRLIVGLRKTVEEIQAFFLLFFSQHYTYFVAVAMHIALASPISGHFVASSNQFPNCLIGSSDTS